MTKYIIGSESFPSKKAVTKRCQDILGSGKIESKDNAFLLALFQRHPGYEIKVGSGIERIEIAKTPYGNRCFFIRRHDSSIVDISYLQCLTPVSHVQKVKSVFRDLIRYQIVEFKENNFTSGLTCPYTGELLTWDNCHVDHYDPTFDQIFMDFIECWNTDTFHIQVIDKSYGWALASHQGQIGIDWKGWHYQTAKLRLISVKANLSMAKK